MAIGDHHPTGIYHIDGNLLKETEVERDLGIYVTTDLLPIPSIQRNMPPDYCGPSDVRLLVFLHICSGFYS